jgi:hypothetical protein
MQVARELTYVIAPQTKPLIDNHFNRVGRLLGRARICEMADRTIGIDHLSGWVDTTLEDGTISSVRAFGARSVHIIPGNGGGPHAVIDAIVRTAVTRGDCIIKTTASDPFTAVAIGRTMCEMAPDHPITRHVAVAYWPGGDVAFEERLYQPFNLDKIVAWGGFASVKHVTRYIQPGLELISLDPKYSISVIDVNALLDQTSRRETALRLAVDVGTGNQMSCSAARIAYVITDGLDDGVELANRLGEWVYEEMIGLPEGMSTKPKAYEPELRASVEAARQQEEWYRVIGGQDGEGAVIVSQLADPVDFMTLLADRTVNIVPVPSVEDVLARCDSYTQTIGVHPEALLMRLRDIAPLYGAQRLVPLGYSSHHTWCGPHDGLELDRRLCKWIVSLKRPPIDMTFAGSTRQNILDATYTPATLDALKAR